MLVVEDRCTLPEFVLKYDGKFVNFDTVYGPQCMDLYRQYVKEVLGFPQLPGVGIASQVWYQNTENYYDKIPYISGVFPLPGDIVIWHWRYGRRGHIAIVTGVGVKGPICFSQNDPGGSSAILKEYDSYKNILGWFHPRVAEKSTEIFPITYRR